ncbi:MAG: hemin uptake protein HemP [Casimicrobiaceae bacterium]|nr:hemin uptake protein HemP [Casimicrobiaceae bacterium]MDW8312148.1 hemin uptake protein HemP [Burkholderiales bacterium]
MNSNHKGYAHTAKQLRGTKPNAKRSPSPVRWGLSAGESAQALPASPVALALERCVRSEELLGSAKRLTIEHDGKRYVLRLTKRKRLLLTAAE